MNWFIAGVVAIAAVFADAYILMLGMGIAHSDWWRNVPPISFNSSFLITISLAALISIPFAAWETVKGVLL